MFFRSKPRSLSDTDTCAETQSMKYEDRHRHTGHNTGTSAPLII